MANYEQAARRAAKRYGIDPDIFVAQLRQESGLREGVSSPAGARDIAQFMPATAKAYGVTLGDNRAADDLDGAARYMRDNLKRAGGDYKAALSIYNSGRPDAYKDPHFAGGQTYNYVRSILAAAKSSGKYGSPSKSPSRASYATIPGTPGTPGTPGVDNSALRRQLVGQFLQTGGVANPQAVLTLAGQYGQAADVPGTPGTPGTPSRTVTTSTPSGPAGTGTSVYRARADAINAKHPRYQWGGGHGSKPAPLGVPVDCSGAVSQVLGIDPRVSGQFTRFGKPGDGGNKGVTIYANDKHVLMKIDGHFFGTSSTNPGGGAGWIPQGAISPEYLKGFTARHI